MDVALVDIRIGQENGLDLVKQLQDIRPDLTCVVVTAYSDTETAIEALKSGGVYGVVDHTRRHMEYDNHENRRRIDPVLVIKEVQEAGFEFVDYSDLHFRADDELRYEVGRRSVSGNTDRFTFLFRKP